MQEVQKVRFREEIILEQNSFPVYQFSFFFNSLYTMRYYLHTRHLQTSSITLQYLYHCTHTK